MTWCVNLYSTLNMNRMIGFEVAWSPILSVTLFSPGWRTVSWSTTLAACTTCTGCPPSSARSSASSWPSGRTRPSTERQGFKLQYLKICLQYLWYWHMIGKTTYYTGWSIKSKSWVGLKIMQDVRCSTTMPTCSDCYARQKMEPPKPKSTQPSYPTR